MILSIYVDDIDLVIVDLVRVDEIVDPILYPFVEVVVLYD